MHSDGVASGLFKILSLRGGLGDPGQGTRGLKWVISDLT